MPIKIQGKFGQEFLDRLPTLEKEMVRHELNPEDFVIVKSASNRRGFSSDYMITVQEQSFTVNMANDAKFLKYFYGICFPSESHRQIVPAEHKMSALLHRLGKWLAEEPNQE